MPEGKIELKSKLFENIKKGPEKKAVTKAFGLHKPEILESWMHTFAHIRNVCGHHSRLLELIQSCPLVDLKEMGFPVDWKNEKLWSNN